MHVTIMSEKNETLVIGASLKPNRYSNMAIKRLRDHKQNTKAIGLREGEVEDVKIETKQKGFQHIDTVTLYLNPKRQRGCASNALHRPQGTSAPTLRSTWNRHDRAA